jgi:hypothetical protein
MSWRKRATALPNSSADARAQTPAMKLFSPDNSELMRIDSLEREGNRLVIRGKVFGAMPLTAQLRPEEARAALKLVSFRLALFLLTLPFRRKA